MRIVVEIEMPDDVAAQFCDQDEREPLRLLCAMRDGVIEGMAPAPDLLVVARLAGQLGLDRWHWGCECCGREGYFVTAPNLDQSATGRAVAAHNDRGLARRAITEHNVGEHPCERHLTAADLLPREMHLVRVPFDERD